MLYRKAPPRPARMLLAVVGAASAGVVSVSTACGSSAEPMGSVAYPFDAGEDSGGDARDASNDAGPMGVIDSGGDGGAMGAIDSGGDGGAMGAIDAGGDGFVGSMVQPDAGDQ